MRSRFIKAPSENVVMACNRWRGETKQKLQLSDGTKVACGICQTPLSIVYCHYTVTLPRLCHSSNCYNNKKNDTTITWNKTEITSTPPRHERWSFLWLSSLKESSSLAIKPDHRVGTSSEQPRLSWVEFAVQDPCTGTKAKPAVRYWIAIFVLCGPAEFIVVL